MNTKNASIHILKTEHNLKNNYGIKDYVLELSTTQTTTKVGT